MNKKIMPIPKIDFSNIKIGDKIEVHGDRLASFKATASRFNKDKPDSEKVGFDYSDMVNDYVVATRKEYESKKRVA